MPLLLRETATAWGDIGLENNDVQLEVVTPASAHEVKSYKMQREYDAAAREFSNKTEIPWDAFIYYVDPAYKNERSYIEAAKSYYHITCSRHLCWASVSVSTGSYQKRARQR